MSTVRVNQRVVVAGNEHDVLVTSGHPLQPGHKRPKITHNVVALPVVPNNIAGVDEHIAWRQVHVLVVRVSVRNRHDASVLLTTPVRFVGRRKQRAWKTSQHPRDGIRLRMYESLVLLTHE